MLLPCRANVEDVQQTARPHQRVVVLNLLHRRLRRERRLDDRKGIELLARRVAASKKVQQAQPQEATCSAAHLSGC